MKSGATTIFGGLFVSLAVGGLFAWSEWSELTQASETKPRVKIASNEAKKSAGASKGAPGASKSVMPAGQFFGQAAVGYQAAQQCPEIIAKLFCYCGCDVTDEHSSLLDCFTSTHGADCQICTDEAVIAAQMKKEGKSIAEIQQAVDSKYSKEYPFKDESPALKKYKEEALGVKASASGKAPSKELKPGHTAGTCCK
jgi:hypothetical protein